MLYSKKWIFIGIISLAILLVAASVLVSQCQSYADKQVYKYVLESLAKKIPLNEYSFYSHPSTCRGARQEHLPQTDKALFSRFYKNNNLQQKTPGKFSLSGSQYNIVSDSDSLLIYQGKSPVLGKIPKQLINLSHVGFNDSETEALICVESADSGDLVYLKKHESQWKVDKWIYIW